MQAEPAEGRGGRVHHMADAIQREGGAERRIRAGMCGSDGEKPAAAAVQAEPAEGRGGRVRHHMADAIQREGGAERRIRAGMCGSDGGSRRPLPCGRSLRKAEGDRFTIWRMPYSEKEARSAGFELACVDRAERSRQPLPCRRSLRKAEEDGFTIWRTPYRFGR